MRKVVRRASTAGVKAAVPTAERRKTTLDIRAICNHFPVSAD
jgi:hypothetical protein